MPQLEYGEVIQHKNTLDTDHLILHRVVSGKGFNVWILISQPPACKMGTRGILHLQVVRVTAVHTGEVPNAAPSTAYG